MMRLAKLIQRAVPPQLTRRLGDRERLRLGQLPQRRARYLRAEPGTWEVGQSWHVAQVLK